MSKYLFDEIAEEFYEIVEELYDSGYAISKERIDKNVESICFKLRIDTSIMQSGLCVKHVRDP